MFVYTRWEISGLLFNLYTNELPIVHTLLDTPMYTEITSKPATNCSEINHIDVQFVDDNTSVISTNNHGLLKGYVESYFSLLKEYYNANKLKVNPSKTHYMVVCKNRLRPIFKNFFIKVDNFIIKPSSTLKILGVFVSQDLKWDKEISKLSSNLHNRLNNIKKLNKFTNFKTRIQFVNSFVVGKLRYMLPIYMNSTLDNINRLHKVVMTAARTSIGNYCIRKSTSQILEICKWLPIRQMIMYSSLCIIHKVLTTYLPHSLAKMYNIDSKNRRAKEIVT